MAVSRVAKSCKIHCQPQGHVLNLENALESIYSRAELEQDCGGPCHLSFQTVDMLEAATMGKPIITANLKSGTTEVNTHNLNGMTFEKSNISELVQILKLFATNDDLCDRLGHANRKKYVENYSRRLFGESYKRVYDLIISGRK